MNIINGHITDIKSFEGISLVQVSANDTLFTSIVLDTAQTSSYLKKDNMVNIIFKETEVILSKDFQPNISIQNRLLCSIASIKEGVLLSEIHLNFGKYTLKSIITSRACKSLALQPDDQILALIKTNEISLAQYD